MKDDALMFQERGKLGSDCTRGASRCGPLGQNTGKSDMYVCVCVHMRSADITLESCKGIDSPGFTGTNRTAVVSFGSLFRILVVSRLQSHLLRNDTRFYIACYSSRLEVLI